MFELLERFIDWWMQWVIGGFVVVMMVVMPLLATVLVVHIALVLFRAI